MEFTGTGPCRDYGPPGEASVERSEPMTGNLAAAAPGERAREDFHRAFIAGERDRGGLAGYGYLAVGYRPCRRHRAAGTAEPRLQAQVSRSPAEPRCLRQAAKHSWRSEKSCVTFFSTTARPGCAPRTCVGKSRMRPAARRHRTYRCGVACLHRTSAATCAPASFTAPTAISRLLPNRR